MAGHAKLKVRPGGSSPASSDAEVRGLRFGVAVAEFNDFVTDRLLQGTLEGFTDAGVDRKQLEIVKVPGSFELPVAAKQMAATGRFDALICIGCVIRGETSHYDYVCSETARGIQLAQLDSGVPVGFCVLTCDTKEQALARAGGKDTNKGFAAAMGAIQMAQLSRKFSGKPPRANSPATSKPRAASAVRGSKSVKRRR
jgi:6,7-dimethyl-8-ribityllumazine synthase